MQSLRLCEITDCEEPAISSCDECDRYFCEEHCGQRGGDRQVQDVGAVAYPAFCAPCLQAVYGRNRGPLLDHEPECHCYCVGDQADASDCKLHRR